MTTTHDTTHDHNTWPQHMTQHMTTTHDTTHDHNTRVSTITTTHTRGNLQLTAWQGKWYVYINGCHGTPLLWIDLIGGWGRFIAYTYNIQTVKLFTCTPTHHTCTPTHNVYTHTCTSAYTHSHITHALSHHTCTLTSHMHTHITHAHSHHMCTLASHVHTHLYKVRKRFV